MTTYRFYGNSIFNIGNDTLSITGPNTTISCSNSLYLIPSSNMVRIGNTTMPTQALSVRGNIDIDVGGRYMIDNRMVLTANILANTVFAANGLISIGPANVASTINLNTNTRILGNTTLTFPSSIVNPASNIAGSVYFSNAANTNVLKIYDGSRYVNMRPSTEVMDYVPRPIINDGGVTTSATNANIYRGGAYELAAPVVASNVVFSVGANFATAGLTFRMRFFQYPGGQSSVPGVFATEIGNVSTTAALTAGTQVLPFDSPKLFNPGILYVIWARNQTAGAGTINGYTSSIAMLTTANAPNSYPISFTVNGVNGATGTINFNPIANTTGVVSAAPVIRLLG